MEENRIENLGEYIKTKREEQELSIDDVSQSTKIKTYILRQIEDNNFDGVDDIGLIKIMITTYSKHLKIDPDLIQAKIVQLFDKPLEPPVKITTAKTKKTMFIPTNAIYFFLLGLLIVFLGVSIYKIYKNDTFSFNALKQQFAATTTETKDRTPVQHEELPPDTLWVLQRQIFHETNNIPTNAEPNEQIVERLGFFGRRSENTNVAVRTVNFNRAYLYDDTDYVGEIIFKNKISPLNPEM